MSFILVLGFFLLPNSLAACKNDFLKVVKQTKKENLRTNATFSKLESSCEKGTCTEGCCNKKSKDCGHSDCDGDCSLKSCSTLNSGVAVSSPFLEIGKNDKPFSSLKNKLYHFKNPFYSFGFHLIWQPPKIG